MAHPLYIRMHDGDNVAIVANNGGLPPATVFADGLTLVDQIPQGHKVALVDLPKGSAVRRYNVPIGYAMKDIPAGSWVHERLLEMPAARGLDTLPMATVRPESMPALDGYTFEGYRNADGSVGTRNILAITTTVQCVAGVVDFAVRRIKAELLPRFSNVDDVVGLEHSYGCGVAIDAPDAIIPIRTLRNITLNPNFGGEVMVVSLGCEKLQPERLFPPGTIPIVDERRVADAGDNADAALNVVCLQSENHVGFMSMIDSIMRSALLHHAGACTTRRSSAGWCSRGFPTLRRSWSAPCRPSPTVSAPTDCAALVLLGPRARPGANCRGNCTGTCQCCMAPHEASDLTLQSDGASKHVSPPTHGRKPDPHCVRLLQHT